MAREFERVVVDTGVLVSALISPGGPTSLILDALDAEDFTLIASPALLDELTRVLHRDKFRRYVTIEEADHFVADLRERADLHPDPASVPSVSNDPDDDYLIALARESAADVLVSGDSDLIELGLKELPTIRPAAFLQRLADAE
ncbi:MAG: putative toxin-antitoxin system toxin component, PIN family [Actinomycetota bacterium]|nr:putative toxin-antitoxin system toxin component, PIN family [Actinomycetota bacterium]